MSDQTLMKGQTDRRPPASRSKVAARSTGHEQGQTKTLVDDVIMMMMMTGQWTSTTDVLRQLPTSAETATDN